MTDIPQVQCPDCGQYSPYTVAKCSNCGRSMIFSTSRTAQNAKKKACQQTQSGAKHTSKAEQSSQWQCPHCRTIIFKNAPLKQIEQSFRSGTLVLKNPIHCPECGTQLDASKLLGGDYDHNLARRPSQKELDNEAFLLFERHVIEAATKPSIAQSGDPEDVARYAIDRAGQILFEKYGLTQDELIHLLGRVFEKQVKPDLDISIEDSLRKKNKEQRVRGVSSGIFLKQHARGYSSGTFVTPPGFYQQQEREYIWINDPDIVKNQQRLLALIARLSVDKNWPNAHTSNLMNKVLTGKFTIEPDNKRGGVKLIF